MPLRRMILDIVSSYSDEKLFKFSSDKDGLLLTVKHQLFNECKKGKGSKNLLNQFIHLQILEEQGLAEKFVNGFLIRSENAVCLDADHRELFQLPKAWSGSLELKITEHSTRTDCRIDLILVDNAERQINTYQLKGPLLLTDAEVYLLNALQWDAFKAVQDHKSLDNNARSEFENLNTIFKLQCAQKEGLDINLRHFDINRKQLSNPKNIAVSLDIDEESNGKLSPAFRGVDTNEVETRRHQLEGGDRQSFRVNNQIILLDEKKVAAVQEILTNQHIPQEKLKDFIKTPTAFLDAQLVNLDLGFSLRVQGVKKFTYAYFGETDENGIEWFSANISAENIFAPSRIAQIVNNEEELNELEEKIEAAIQTGAKQVKFKDKILDLSDIAAVKEAIAKKRKQLNSPDIENLHQDIDDDDNDDIQVAIDIATNDIELEFGDENEEAINNVLFEGEINWEEYKREPFDYQKKGIRWLLGLLRPTIDLEEHELGKSGCLLADDMGLGKTFMSLVALREYLTQINEQNLEEKPVLVVAPLSLIENWKDEVSKTYIDSPFNETIILQTNVDLPKYRVTGARNETTQTRDADIDHIRYALKVGPDYGPNRLDQSKRLILTTYQTLRDYQFSLAVIDWSVVVFDEAQNIKNPNTLATIAAKALKAHFKILATGTPVENSLADFWCIMDTAKPGCLDAYQEFRKKYIKPILQAHNNERTKVKIRIGKRLRNDVGNLMLRRVKEDQLDGLPKKYIYTGSVGTNNEIHYPLIRCVMTDKQQQSYDRIVELVDEGNSPYLSGLQRLRDVSLHPSLLEGGGIPIPKDKNEAENVIKESGKLTKVLSLLKVIQSREEKVILFMINKNLQAFLKVALEKIFEQTVSIINGDTKAVSSRAGVQTRKQLIEQFEEQNGFGVIIMSPIAAGTGLTIVGANNVVHVERHWNPAKEAQATDRVYRIGQERDVHVYLPVLFRLNNQHRNTFDQNLDKRVNMKMALRDAVVTPEEVDPNVLGDSIFGETAGQPVASTVYEPEDLKNLSWQQFEAFSAELLASYFSLNDNDVDAILTKKGADRGADIVIQGLRNILVQVKHTQSEQLRAKKPVREVFAARPLYQNRMGVDFDEIVVITNAKRVSQDVLDEARICNVKLFYFRDIREMMQNHKITEKNVIRRIDKKRFAL